MEHGRKELAGVRTGRATTNMLDTVHVEAYGSLVPLNQVAQLSIPEPTMILAQGGALDLWRVVGTLVGGAASAGSASVFNMYFDRDIDARMSRTSRRPIVRGDVSPRSALIFAWTLAAFATASETPRIAFAPSLPLLGVPSRSIMS